jgi:hypothetical protein
MAEQHKGGAVEVTDEMVERAFIWLNHNACFGGEPFDESRRQVRKALEAALNPPPEPEIPVSEGMRKAGADTAYAPKFWMDEQSRGPSTPFSGLTASQVEVICSAVYCAMEAKRREEEGARCGVGSFRDSRVYGLLVSAAQDRFPDDLICRAGAMALCRRHQAELRGEEGDDLEKRCKILCESYDFEAQHALRAMLKAACDVAHRRKDDPA